MATNAITAAHQFILCAVPRAEWKVISSILSKETEVNRMVGALMSSKQASMMATSPKISGVSRRAKKMLDANLIIRPSTCAEPRENGLLVSPFQLSCWTLSSTGIGSPQYRDKRNLNRVFYIELYIINASC